MADQMVVLGNRVADENETLIKQLEKVISHVACVFDGNTRL